MSDVFMVGRSLEIARVYWPFEPWGHRGATRSEAVRHARRPHAHPAVLRRCSWQRCNARNADAKESRA